MLPDNKLDLNKYGKSSIRNEFKLNKDKVNKYESHYNKAVLSFIGVTVDVQQHVGVVTEINASFSISSILAFVGRKNWWNVVLIPSRSLYHKLANGSSMLHMNGSFSVRICAESFNQLFYSPAIQTSQGIFIFGTGL